MSNEDKRADEIVEETMKSIYEDLDNLDKEEEHSESGEEFEKRSMTYETMKKNVRSISVHPWDS